MITTYAVSFSTVDCSPAQQTELVDLVTDWQMATYPYDPDTGYRPGVIVRSRYASDDPVFRLTISDGLPSSSHVTITTVTVVLLEGVLGFDVRVVSTPNTHRIAPYTPQLVPVNVVELVRKVVDVVPTYDAERRIVDKTANIRTEIDGIGIGHFILAPSRRLPVVVEVSDQERRTEPLLARGPGPLTGLVHMVLLDSAEALHGYQEVIGNPLVGPGCISVHWAGGAQPEILNRHHFAAATERAQAMHLTRSIIDAAARSVAPPRVPPPPRRDDDIIDSPARQADDESTQGEDDMSAYVEQLEAEKNGLEAALSVANQMIADQRLLLEDRPSLRKDQIDQIIARNVFLELMIGKKPQLASFNSVLHAVQIGQNIFDNLVFHPRAIDSAEALHGPDPALVFDDLRRLNDVARLWKSGRIAGASITSACQAAGLDYVGTISDTARQKFVEDYIIDWNGRTVVAEAHIRRGRGSHLVRIHVYFDEETRQAVVAYIGRHLRDKSSR